MATRAHKLDPRALRFARAYAAGATAGDLEGSAQAAGFRGTSGRLRATAERLLGDPMVRAELERLRQERPGTMRLEDLLAWWSRFVLEDGAEPRDRLKASELLGRAIGAFAQVHKVEVSGALGVGGRVDVKRMTDEELEAIIAESD